MATSPFEPSGFFVLRTPFLSFDEFLSWSDGLEATGSLNNPARFLARLYDSQLARSKA